MSEERPILTREQVVDYLHLLYSMSEIEQTRELIDLSMSHRANPNYLQDMALRFHGDRERPVFTEAARQMVDTVLEMYDPAQGTKHSHTSLIRSTGSAKHELPSWKACRDRIYVHVAITSGEDEAKRMFRGSLYDKDELRPNIPDDRTAS